jgi:hypothetical protein
MKILPVATVLLHADRQIEVRTDMTKLTVTPKNQSALILTRIKWTNKECTERINAYEILVGTPKRRRISVNVGTFEYDHMSAVQEF